MFIFIIMTCGLHVHDVFNRMFVMARPCQVRFLFKFCIRGLFILLFIIAQSLMKLVLALKKWLRI